MIDFLLIHLDYVAMAAIVLGYFRMAAFKIDGWLWTLLGSILLVIFGAVDVRAPGVAIGNTIFIYLTIRGFIKWRKKLKN